MTPKRREEVREYLLDFLTSEIQEVIDTRDGYICGLYQVC